MLHKFYINWDNQEFLDEEEKEERLDYLENYNYDDYLNEFLNIECGFDCSDIFQMPEKDKERVQIEFAIYSRERAVADFNEEFECIEKYIEEN